MKTLISLGLVGTVIFAAAACSSGGTGSGSTSGGGGQNGSSQGPGGPGAGPAGSTSNVASSGSSGTAGGTPGSSSASEVAKKLGRSAHFLIGMGNDLDNDHSKDGAYTLGTTLDIHYCYLVGLPGQGGWPDWNSNGSFVNIMTDSADAKGVVPMFTLYAMAAQGDGNTAVTTQDAFMKPYWDAAKLLFQRLAMFNKPAIVQLEPDFWGYVLQKSPGGDPSKFPVHVASLAPDCGGQPDNLVGMGHCLVHLARSIAPKVVVGFHASPWGGTPQATVKFFNAIGADQADLMTVDALDRDAGCFEAHTDPNCMRNDGPWYLDETNKTSPNFHDHLAWVKSISDGTKKPILWWQVPFGVPSNTPGGSAGKYRDNRVKYMFAHTDEFVAAGGLGAAFGTGAGNQTYITTDGGQFKGAVGKYFASPTPLP